MKKLLYVLLLLSSTPFYSQAIANQPTNLVVCDTLNNGIESINLTVKNTEILGSQSAENFSVFYYNNLAAAQSGSNAIGDNYLASNEVIFARVTELGNPSNFAITNFQIILQQMVVPAFPPLNPVCEGTQVILGVTSLNGITGFWNNNISFETPPGTYNFTFMPDPGQCAEIITMSFTVYPKPIAHQANSISISDTPYDGIGTFDLSQQVNTIIGEQNNLTVTFHQSLADAVNGVNAIANPGSYINTSNPQLIGVKVINNVTGCFTFSSFSISVINPDPAIIHFNDVNFKNKIVAASPSNTTAYSGGVAVKVDINNDLEIQFTEAAVIDSLNVQYPSGGVYADYIVDLKGIEGFPNLKKFRGSGNKVLHFNLNTNVLLEYIDLSANLLTAINAAQLSNLKLLNCSNNLLTSLNISGCTNLLDLYCSFNNLSFLELSASTSMQNVDISYNPVEIIFAKNGSDEYIYFPECPNLTFICVDDFQLQEVSANATNFGALNCNISTYCTFTPGGDFNTISGNNKLDLNNNGCDANDITIPFLSFDVSLNGVDTTNNVFCNSLGYYNLFTNQEGVYGLIPNLEDPTYFNVSPNPATVNIPLINNSTTIQNFCITANGVQPDLEIVIVPVIPARPGFDAVYKIVYKNKGNLSVNGVVNFTYNDAVLDFISSSVLPTNSGSGFMNWNISNVNPFQVGTFLVTFNVNSPQEIPAVNIDDVLSFTATINTPSDVNAADNSFDFDQIVVGSYDPNDVVCLQGNSLPTAEMGKYLHYNIRFENTGTAAAENIVVASTINLSQYDIQSLQVMESSHPVEIRVTGNLLEFIHQGISLNAGGHGNILLKMKSQNALTNDLVVNSAEIFFDYNFPIETNDEQTVFADLSKNDIVKDLSIQVYPNPAQSQVTIKAENNIKTIQLYDVQGRLLLTKLANQNSETIDISHYTTGVYFINIKSEEGSQTIKVVKNQ